MLATAPLSAETRDHLLRGAIDLAGEALERRFRDHGSAEPETLLYDLFIVGQASRRYREGARRYLTENAREPVCALMLSAFDARDGLMDSANAHLAHATASPDLDAVLGGPSPGFVESVLDCEARKIDLPPSADGYRDPSARLNWYRSYRQSLDGPALSSDVARSAALHFQTVMQNLGQATRVTNFGSFVPHADARLAYAFPDVEFIGIDRDPDIVSLARADYPGLTLKSGDARDLIDGPGILTHTKTATFVLPHVLREIYARAWDRGIDKVIVLEPWSMDGLTRRYPVPGAGPVFLRGGMMLHDYPEMLERAGYRVTERRLLPFNWIGMGRMHIPMHLVCVVAER